MQRLLGTVDEDILLARVTVHVYKGHDFFILWNWSIPVFLAFFVGPVEDFAGEVLDRPHGGVEAEVGLDVAPIEVVAGHARSVVPYDHAVGVDHRNDFEYDALAELLGLVAVA